MSPASYRAAPPRVGSEYLTGTSAQSQIGYFLSMPVQVSDAEFDAMVEQALDAIPDDLASLCHNVVVLVEEWPGHGVPKDTLGLYDGVALPDRPANHAGLLPDRILIFRQPLLAYCNDEVELRKQIEITIAHEIAHFFGIGHDVLDALGYG